MASTAWFAHHRQIELALRARVPTLRPGERLPSDSDLCREFGVSRMTARNPMQHLADGVPTALGTAVLVSRTGDAVMAADLETGSLHEALARAGLELRHGTATITSEAATAEDATVLAVGVGEPLLVERRVIADVSGRPVEATESRDPGDRYALDVRFVVDDGARDTAS